MKKIITFSMILLFSSCTSSEPKLTSEGDYATLQVKLHSMYSLFKALNAGIISQEEYDELKKNILDI